MPKEIIGLLVWRIDPGGIVVLSTHPAEAFMSCDRRAINRLCDGRWARREPDVSAGNIYQEVNQVDCVLNGHRRMHYRFQ